MQNVNIYIWGDERQNTHHFLDYINNSKTNAISLFFLKHKPAGLTRQKNVYLFDFPDEKNVAWIDIICTIVDKIHATSVRIHSAVHYAQTINFALIKAFRSRTENGLSLTLFLYESSLNDIAWRQEIDKSLSAGLRWQDYAQQFNAKLTRDSGGWHPLYRYLFNSFVETHYYFERLYLNKSRTLFSAPQFHYADLTDGGAAAPETVSSLLAMLEIKMSTVTLLRDIVASKKTLFFIDDGSDYPLGEAEKDTCLWQAIQTQGYAFVFLVNYTGNLDSHRVAGVSVVRLPPALTTELLSLCGITPDALYGFCSPALLFANTRNIKKIFFHEHCDFAPNKTLVSFLSNIQRGHLPCLYVNETQKRQQSEAVTQQIFLIGESMGDALFAVGSINALRKDLSGEFIFIAPKIYHNLLALCPWIDALWAPDELDQARKEAIHMAQVLGNYHTPCSGKHIFATQHQIDSILAESGRKKVSNAHKAIVLAVDKIDTTRVDRFLHENHLTQKVVLIHPNVGVPNRTWPRERWEALIEHFFADGWSVVLIGANNNFYAYKKTVEIGNSRVFNAIDRFTMAETVYLMTKSTLLVACDSGPVALAAATDIAICALYSVVPGKYRLPFRHGVLGWNALAIDLSCQYQHCAKHYPQDTRGTFDAWCPNNATYACVNQYPADAFYRAITQFVGSDDFIDPLTTNNRNAQ